MTTKFLATLAAGLIAFGASAQPHRATATQPAHHRAHVTPNTHWQHSAPAHARHKGSSASHRKTHAKHPQAGHAKAQRHHSRAAARPHHSASRHPTQHHPVRHGAKTVRHANPRPHA